MTGFAVARILQEFAWNQVGIIMERKLDIIWLLTKNGLEYALTEKNITVGKSVLITDESNLKDILVETTMASRSKMN